MRAISIKTLIALASCIFASHAATAQSGSGVYPGGYVGVAPAPGQEREAQQENWRRQQEEERRRNQFYQYEQNRLEQQRQWQRQIDEMDASLRRQRESSY